MCIGNSAPGHSQFYDEVYFDSSESSDEGDIDRSSVSAGNSEKVPTQKRRRDSAARKVKKLTNDELFYDPNMDEEDEKWMNRRRMAYHNGEARCAHVVKGMRCALIRSVGFSLILWISS